MCTIDSRRLTSNIEISRRTSFIGVLAWLSVCLMTTSVYPEAAIDLRSLWMTSGLVGLISTVGLMEVVKRDARLQAEVLAQYIEECRTDGLTGVANRREFDRTLGNLLEESGRTQSPLNVNVFLIDIDHFKRINDTWGHLAGDEVLKSTGRTLASCLRKCDLIARYGGEEFVVISSQATAETARMLSERMRTAIERQDFSFDGQTTGVTVSIGVTSPEDGDNAAALIHRADTALYRAKEAGRNCTFSWTDGTCVQVTLTVDRCPSLSTTGTTATLEGLLRDNVKWFERRDSVSIPG